MALVGALAVAAAACSSAPTPGDRALGESSAPSVVPAANSGPVVEVVSPSSPGPRLDPSAEPRTPLGELRARYLPVWSPEFDWAFPPDVCGSDWALDAIAEPASDVMVGVLGDHVAAAGLSVMRYEHLLSEALAVPDVTGQLCVAVATVGTARAEALEMLAAHLALGTRSTAPPAYPDEVRVVALSLTTALVVACSTARGPGETAESGKPARTPAAPVTLAAYLLPVSRGLEDAVADVSFRVSDIVRHPAADCSELEAWVAEWDSRVEEWVAEGAIWQSVSRLVSAEQLCGAPAPHGPTECPKDWVS